MIKLVDKYFMTADNNQYTLLECGKRPKIDIKTKKPTGEMIDYEEQIGYYGNLTALINGCINIYGKEIVANEEVKTLKELINKLSDLEEKIIDATRGF